MKHARGGNFPVTFSSLCGPILGFLGFLGLLPFGLLKGLMVTFFRYDPTPSIQNQPSYSRFCLRTLTVLASVDI